jgi:streptogramin lyase
LDLNRPKEERAAVQVNGGTGVAGHRDGDLDQALVNKPCMIFQDSQDNIYLADEYNHCIRRITPEKQVETVLGIPGKAGWQDGAKESALFNRPRGICIDQDDNIYVCDYGNARIRKLSVN